MSTSIFTAVVTREGDQFVALCPEFDIASQGSTADEAVANLKAAIGLFLDTAADDEVTRRRREVVATMRFEVHRP